MTKAAQFLSRWILLVLIGALVGGCGLAAEPPAGEPRQSPAAQPVSHASHDATGTLTAYFFDVGQGDATLLAGPDFTILIDAGRHERRDVVPHLLGAGVTSIDLLIGTHPHADHIGQFPQVLETFPVLEVWLSGDEHTTRTFERTLDAIAASQAGYHEPRAGEVYEIGSARVEVLNPDSLTGDFHEGCIAVRVVFGDVAFAFTGDIETPTELAMIERGHAPKAQILQLGHHGSHTSSSLEFLQAVQPEVAIYSAAEDNSYGHPHGEVVDRLANLHIPLYGTPEHGTIRVVTDGRTYKVETQWDAPIRGPPAGGVAGGCSPGRININTASKEQLQRIAHIGSGRAEQLIRLRPFTSLGELTGIDGIGADRLHDIKTQGLACVD